MDLPEWIKTKKLRAPEYVKLFEEVRLPNGMTCTDKVSKLLMTTGLPRETLGYIWAAANKQIPGILQEQEFYIVLSLVALAQNGTPLFNLNQLKKIPDPPIPFFNGGSSLEAQRYKSQQASFNNQNEIRSTLTRSSTNEEDEFSDFQSAPINYKASGNNNKGINDKSSSMSRFESPVHGIANCSKEIPSSMALTAPVLTFQLPDKLPTQESMVGSRLANYNLGANSSGETVGPPNRNPDKLLIGEEDKYSALRSLKVESGHLGSKEKSRGCSERRPSSTDHEISFVSEDVLQVVKTENSLDFGDFQTFVSPDLINKTDPPTYSTMEKKLDVNINLSFSPIQDVTPMGPSSSRPDVSHDEFGDFISCNGGRVGNDESATQKIGSSGINPRSHKSNQGKLKGKNLQFQIGCVEKASEILAESPTFSNLLPGLDLKRCEPNWSNSDPSVREPRPVPHKLPNQIHFDDPIVSQSFRVDHKEFGGSLKTTLINSNNLNGEVMPSDKMQFEESFNLSEKSSSFVSLPSKQKSPETQSVASLDLGNYSSWDVNEGQRNTYDSGGPQLANFPQMGNAPESEAPQSSSFLANKTPPLENAYHSDQLDLSAGAESAPPFPAANHVEDKYLCFKEEIDNERERYTQEWVKCLNACFFFINQTVSLFNSASSSGVVREVVSSENGHTFILSLLEVYRVANRVYRSSEKLNGVEMLENIYRNILLAWESLTPFLLGSPQLEKINLFEELSEAEYSDYSRICGVCLFNSKNDELVSMVDYGGKFYHSSCANFWINGVDPILPSLSYVSSF